MDRYVLGERIDQSYLSVVYHGVERSTGRAAVLKFNKSLKHAPLLPRIMALDHPNLLVPSDVFMHDGSLVEVSPYCDWQLLSRVKKDVPLEVISGLGVQLAEALAALHGKGVVHHDVRGENVFVSTYFLQARLFDFDNACEPYFLEKSIDSWNDVPPEARTGACRVDFQWDVYQAGRLLQELTHSYDWGANKEIPKDRIPAGLLVVVQRAQADRKERYASGRELADALRRVS
ncbi:protein kinase [Candidatus Woesearchaeota archaeon]|nr:protein kinase [Candidatus Woesearchaeota archaeon]